MTHYDMSIWAFEKVCCVYVARLVAPRLQNEDAMTQDLQHACIFSL